MLDLFSGGHNVYCRVSYFSWIRNRSVYIFLVDDQTTLQQ